MILSLESASLIIVEIKNSKNVGRIEKDQRMVLFISQKKG
jgi:hypothetical protein